ncbi:Beta-L-arabinobiosidase [Pseudocercospora fuligena]|uniref:Beta-L-arabinobiosidase n=1 Tax=Pseudocercospora fuligena TaxID=685502 RepID=A0A8H6VDA8_9PEZI|nr:Beta-L-arabinobiosidase [Pseudocercospora fuligena]
MQPSSSQTGVFEHLISFDFADFERLTSPKGDVEYTQFGFVPRNLAQLLANPHSARGFVGLHGVLKRELDALMKHLNADKVHRGDPWAYVGIDREDGEGPQKYSPILYRPSEWHLSNWTCHENDDSHTRIFTIGSFTNREKGTNYTVLNSGLTSSNSAMWDVKSFVSEKPLSEERRSELVGAKESTCSTTNRAGELIYVNTYLMQSARTCYYLNNHFIPFYDALLGMADNPIHGAVRYSSRSDGSQHSLPIPIYSREQDYKIAHINEEVADGARQDVCYAKDWLFVSPHGSDILLNTSGEGMCYWADRPAITDVDLRTESSSWRGNVAIQKWFKILDHGTVFSISCCVFKMHRQASLLLAVRLVQAALDTSALAKQYFGNDSRWYQDKIPYFEISDQEIQDVYYYRWTIFRAHQRDLGERGYVSTEFLDDVSWQLEPWATLNDATGFHLGEGRWLRDRRYADDYIRHMYNGGNDRHFTDYTADSVYGRYLVDGDEASLITHLNAMTDLYDQWDENFDADKGLYWREPLADATEYTISSIDASGGEDGFTGGYAFRPSINSYMWANAIAISKIADLAGQSSVASDFRQRASTLKDRFQTDIWNTTLEHFIDRHQRDTEFVKYWEPIRGRELVGLVPWMFSMPDDKEEYNQAWTHLLDPEKLRGENGMRTNEPSYEYYMRQYRYDEPTGLRECQWNGPVWPYQTTQVLLGMANLLNGYNQSIITKADYVDELRRYTKLHYLDGKLNLQEDYEPDKVGPIVGLPRSHHYFHSGYNDVVISGLIGIRPRGDDVLEVSPIAEGIGWFRLQDVVYHGRDIAVEWDADGSRYGRGVGLRVEVDGEVMGSSSKLEKIEVSITKANAPAIDRSKMAKSIQLVRDEFSKGSASSGNDTERIHDAIDGRVWFYPELPQGWDSNATEAASQQWYAIDFGSATELTGCELAFFADGDDFEAPSTYDVQQLVDGEWVKIVGEGEQVIANGITHVSWGTLSTSQLRVEFPQAAGKRTRLAEFKAF